MNLRNVRMIQRRQRLRLAMEAGNALGIVGEIVGQNFQRHIPLQLRVVRAKHTSHAAFTNERAHLERTHAAADG